MDVVLDTPKRSQQATMQVPAFLFVCKDLFQERTADAPGVTRASPCEGPVNDASAPRAPRTWI